MDTSRRPSLADRAKSTPLFVNTLSNTPKARRTAPSLGDGLGIFTPPSSPRHTRSSSNLSNKTDDSFDHSHYDEHEPVARDNSHTGRSPNGFLICPFEVEILKDQNGRNQTFGYGAWSTVFKGTCHSKTTSGLVTPPLSPWGKPPLLVAVKQPARKDAKIILENEGKILSFLISQVGSEGHIVPFYGIQSSTSSLILAAMPLSLEEHIKRSAVSAKASRTTWNMTEPVIGNTSVWLDLAYKLISALAWLHDKAMVVHGDIKPGNILLDRTNCGDEVDSANNNDRFLHKPLFADFSSSQRLDGEITLNTLSAVTREYTAPELLSSKVLSDPKSTATTATDVFSLAVTLLVAATGNTMVYSGSVFQRQAMATQGWMVIQAARNGPFEEGARIPRQGVVERTLDRAVLRHGMGRIDAASWKFKVEEVLKGEPNEL